MARRVAEPPGASEESSEPSCRILSSKASSFVFVAPRRSVGLRGAGCSRRVCAAGVRPAPGRHPLRERAGRGKQGSLARVARLLWERVKGVSRACQNWRAAWFRPMPRTARDGAPCVAACHEPLAGRGHGAKCGPMTRTAGGKVLGISATAPVTIAGEAVRCPRDPAATARRDSAPFQQSGTV